MSEQADGDEARRTVDERVKALYTRYPYPSVEMDTGVALFALLDYARHVLWPARPTLDGLRILDAGCGTGLAAVQIARAHPQVQVVGVDISAASLDVARRRAAAAGLGASPRLTFQQSSIEDLTSESGPFDYIVASGVLHHMGDPAQGARCLARLLAPTGGMGVMLYAPHGRHGVYLLQEALRRMAGDRDLAQQVGLARQVLAGLSPGHPFKPGQFTDQSWADDAGLVDLLLHARDRSFSVPQVYDLLEHSGLRLERFFNPLAYRPESHAGDPDLKASLAAVPEKDGAILAELLSGAMPMHAFFATHAGYRPVRLIPNEITLPLLRPVRSPLFLWDELRQAGGTNAKGRPHDRKAPRTFKLVERQTGVVTRTLELERWIVEILERCDGTRTSQEIAADPAVVTLVPAAGPREKELRARQLLQFFGQQEILLFNV